MHGRETIEQAGTGGGRLLGELVGITGRLLGELVGITGATEGIGVGRLLGAGVAGRLLG
jgi:hypothetical protein